MVSRVEQQIIDCIENKQNFVLDAGAGSGKTTTLVSTLNYLLSKKSKELQQYNQKIVCITYTNVAKNEIIERTEHNSLIIVNTIHDFLWDCIKSFQKELKIKLLDIVSEKLSNTKNEQATKKSTTTKVYKELTEKIEKYTSAINSLSEVQKIEYKNFTAYDKGIFSHDDLIVIAEKMFSFYPKLNKIISSLYPFIFVDEYQDTQKETIEILLKTLNQEKNCVIGFFGDKMQQIYDTGIGEIPKEYNLRRIPKDENYRSSIEVVNLLNKIRDDIKQEFCKKEHGSILFYHQPNLVSLDTKKFIEENLKSQWHLNGVKDSKILYLTHRFISKENQYEDLYKFYKYTDVITDNKNNRDSSPHTDFLFDIEEIINLYINNKTQDFLNKTTYEINSFLEKKQLKKLMDELIITRNNQKIEDVIKYVIENNILPQSEKMVNYDFEDEDKKQFYENMMMLDYAQFVRLYQVQQEHTPFSTQHGTKGDEFDNVLIVIDDNAWNKYNFNEYFSDINGTSSRIKKSKNLFYVICSRARNNLAILFVSELSDAAKQQVESWFGEIN